MQYIETSNEKTNKEKRGVDMKKNGFGYLELVITVLIGSVIFVGSLSVVSSTQKFLKNTESELQSATKKINHHSPATLSELFKVYQQ
jgi:hypothetical protein